MPRYKVVYKNGQFRYFMANSAEAARGKARADLRKQRGFEHAQGFGGPGVREHKAHPVHSGIDHVEAEGEKPRGVRGY